jgi:hypothetical protein
VLAADPDGAGEDEAELVPVEADVAGVLDLAGAPPGAGEPQAVTSAARPVTAAAQTARRAVDEFMSVLSWAAPLAV